jgi:hypothetical protein
MQDYQTHVMCGDEVCPKMVDYNNKALCIKGNHHYNVWAVNMELDITRLSQHQQTFPHNTSSSPKDKIETPRFKSSTTTLTLS